MSRFTESIVFNVRKAPENARKDIRALIMAAIGGSSTPLYYRAFEQLDDTMTNDPLIPGPVRILWGKTSYDIKKAIFRNFNNRSKRRRRQRR